MYLDSCVLLSLFLADSGYGAGVVSLCVRRCDLSAERAAAIHAEFECCAWLQDTNSPALRKHLDPACSGAVTASALHRPHPQDEAHAAPRRALKQAVKPVVGDAGSQSRYRDSTPGSVRWPSCWCVSWIWR